MLGSGCATADSEVEKEIMMYLPTVVGWIENGDDITEADVRNLKQVVPHHLEFGKKTSFEEVIRMNERYLNDPTWGKYVSVILSDRGKAWMERNLNLLKRFSND